MPPKNISTPIKPSEGSNMTHEDEEVQHDISKLRDHVQQISLSQRVTKNEMEAKMDGLKKEMDGLKKGMEADMDGLKNGEEAKIDGIEEKLKGSMEDLKNGLKA